MTRNLPARITVEADRVILRGDLATAAMGDVEDSTPGAAEFRDLFEVVSQYLRNEDYYDGLHLTAVIRRKADGRLFGYPYFVDTSKYGQTWREPNGDEHGFDWDLGWSSANDDPYDDLSQVFVWLPVEPFTITGYRFPQNEEATR